MSKAKSPPLSPPSPNPPFQFTLVVRHPVPSLNRLFSMTHWSRQREKRNTQAAMLSALSPTAEGSVMRTTSAQSFFVILYDTLLAYRRTPQSFAISKRGKLRFG